MRISQIKRMAGLVLILAVFMLGAAHSSFSATNVKNADAARKARKAGINSYPQSYIIGPDDILEVSVWKNPELSKTVVVRPDGKISLPLIGDVKAAGLTPVSLRSKIIKKLSLFQKNVEASVIVTEVNSYKIFIFGAVTSPGMYKLKSNTHIIQALAMAGGFTQFASKNSIVVIRSTKTGESRRFNIRFKDIVYKKQYKDKNILLQPGDTIFVP